MCCWNQLSEMLMRCGTTDFCRFRFRLLNFGFSTNFLYLSIALNAEKKIWIRIFSKMTARVPNFSKFLIFSKTFLNWYFLFVNIKNDRKRFAINNREATEQRKTHHEQAIIVFFLLILLSLPGNDAEDYFSDLRRYKLERKTYKSPDLTNAN